MDEYGFELRLCAHLERATDGIVSRQIGCRVPEATDRILDIVVIEPGTEFDIRRRITPSSIPPLAIESDVGAGRARPWPGNLDIHPETAARVLDRAVDVGFFEHNQHKGRSHVRQTVRYPDWIGTVTAIENKPNLDTPGDLHTQLRRDVALGVVDRVVLATRSHVTGAHMNRIPREVGVWRVQWEKETLQREVIREPEPLDPNTWGIALGERTPTARHVRAVPPAEKRRIRVRLAERAYGKGWRPAFPSCDRIEVTSAAGTSGLPYCSWFDQVVDPGFCGPDCTAYLEASPPSTDHAAERAARTPWEADPPGVVSQQVGLEEFDPDVSSDA